MPQVLLLAQDLHRASCSGNFQPRPYRLAGAQLHQSGPLLQDPFQKNLDAPAGRLMSHHPRGDDTGVIEDQQSPGFSRSGKSRMARSCGPACGFQYQKAAGGALGQGGLGDQFLGQLEGEVR